MEMVLTAENGEPGKVGGVLLDMLNEEAGVMVMTTDHRWIVNVYMMGHLVEAVVDLDGLLGNIENNFFDAEEYLVLAHVLEKHAKRLRGAVTAEFRERAEATLAAKYEATGKIVEIVEDEE